MGTLTIGSYTYSVYGTQELATEYITGRIGELADNWLATTATTTQRKTQVSATRFIDSQAWAGAKVDSAQANEFPRTGLVDKDGNDVSSLTVPQVILDATYELMMLMLDDATLDASDGSGNVKIAQAGSAKIEYFRPQSGGRFPRQIMDLLAPFMTGGLFDAEALSYVGGTDVVTQFADADFLTLTRGF